MDGLQLTFASRDRRMLDKGGGEESATSQSASLFPLFSGKHHQDKSNSWACFIYNSKTQTAGKYDMLCYADGETSKTTVLR